TSTLKDIAGIAMRFDDQAKVLSAASALPGSAQGDLASTLDGRQEALENLAVGLVKKSEDIERVMQSFEDLVGRALEKAETRTRASTEQIRSSIAEVVDGAAKRFSEATEEIRRTVGSIRGELEQTRAEVKKGVMELPEETKQSTSAMRRAVSEQINALKELADIVAKSGRAFDASDRKAPARGSGPLLPPPPVPAASRPAAPLSDTPLRGGLGAPVKEREQEAPSGGWVKDLLRGASRGEEAGGVASTGER